MIDNIIPFGSKKPLTTAERLHAMAKKAEASPEEHKYLMVVTASADLTTSDWAVAGHPSLLMLLGLIEIIKSEIHTYFKSTPND